MKNFTNNSPGLRGINTTGGTVWIESGQTVGIDPETIVGGLPDLGKRPPRDQTADTSGLDALNAKVAELTKQVEELTKGKADAEKANAELTKQVEELTKPAK